MKVKVEVDIDWIGEDGNLDDDVSSQIQTKLVSQIQKEFSENVGKQIAKQAEMLIKAKTDNLINTMLERPVVVSDGWNNKAKYESIYDMVEKKMTVLYDNKAKTGTACEKDPYLAKVEAYIESETNNLLRGIDASIERHARNAAKKEVEKNKAVKAIKDLMLNSTSQP